MSAQGHMIPMSHIVEELQARGHTVTVVTDNRTDVVRCYQMADRIGCKIVFVQDGRKFKTSAPGEHLNGWAPYLWSATKDMEIDIAVVDFFCFPAIKICDERKIPLVINAPCPLGMGIDFGFLKCPDMRYSTSCCGLVCIRAPWMHTVFKIMFKNYGAENRDIALTYSGR